MKQLAILLLLAFLTFPEEGKSQEQYSLNDLLKQAVENSHEMKKAALQRSESASRTKEVIANGLPQVDGSLDYSRMGIPEINISQEMMDALPEDIAPLLGGLSDIKALHTTSAGVTVSQLLYSKSYLTGVKQVKKAEDLYNFMLQKTEEDVIHDVSASYYQVLMNYSNLKILNDNIHNLEKLYNILKLQYENDFVKQTDVSRLKVTLTNLKTQRETLKNGIQMQKRILKIISGIPVEKELLLDTALVDKMAYQKPVMSEFVLDILPDYQLMKKQNELAGLQIESDKAAFYPNLAAFGQFTYSSYATEFKFKDFNNMNTVGLKATIPIFSSGMRKNRVLQSQLKFQQNQEDFDLNKKYLETGYQNSVNSLLSSWSNIQDQQENKELANEVYGQVKLQFDEGMASLTDLLNVESSLLEAENLFNQQLLKYKLAEIELLKATGKLKTLIN
ncbi:MAG: TolC family protein [Prolixibacteraceae bacterium]|nr:TolC family protein [Prolixibacteraceae bacterium]